MHFTCSEKSYPLQTLVLSKNMPWDSKIPSAFCWPDMTECFTTWIFEMKGVSWIWVIQKSWKIMSNEMQDRAKKKCNKRSCHNHTGLQCKSSFQWGGLVNMLTLWENSLNRFSKWIGSSQCHQVIKLQTIIFSTEANNGSFRGRIRTHCCVGVFGETDWLVCF